MWASEPQLRQGAAATTTGTARAVATAINLGRHTGHAPRSTRGMQCGTAAGNRCDRVGRMSTDTAEYKFNAGPPPLASHPGETGVATATATEITVTVAVARGRHHHTHGDGTRPSCYTDERVSLLA